MSTLPPGFELDPIAPAPAPAPAAPAGLPAGFELDPRPEDRSFLQRTFGDPIARGFNSTQQSAALGGYLLGTATPEEAAEGIIANRADQALYPVQPGDQAARDTLMNPKATWGDWGSALWNNPGTAAQVALESIPATGVSVATGAAGALAGLPAGPVGAALGGAAGVGVGSGITEFGNSIVETLTERGVTVNRETLAAALQNPEIMEAAKKKAAIRGVTVGAFDALTAGVAGRLFNPVSRAAGGKIAGTVAGGGAELGVQAGGGMAGEAGAQLLTEGRITNPGAVALEGIAELPGAVVEPAINLSARTLAGGQNGTGGSVAPVGAQPAGPAVGSPAGIDPLAAQPPAPIGPAPVPVAPQNDPGTQAVAPGAVPVPPGFVIDPPEVQGPPAPVQGPPAPVQGPPAPVQGPPAPVQGPPPPVQGPPAPMQGPPAPMQGPPAPVQGPPPPPVQGPELVQSPTVQVAEPPAPEPMPAPVAQPLPTPIPQADPQPAPAAPQLRPVAAPTSAGALRGLAPVGTRFVDEEINGQTWIGNGHALLVVDPKRAASIRKATAKARAAGAPVPPGAAGRVIEDIVQRAGRVGVTPVTVAGMGRIDGVDRVILADPQGNRVQAIDPVYLDALRSAPGQIARVNDDSGTIVLMRDGQVAGIAMGIRADAQLLANAEQPIPFGGDDLRENYRTRFVAAMRMTNERARRTTLDGMVTALLKERNAAQRQLDKVPVRPDTEVQRQRLQKTIDRAQREADLIYKAMGPPPATQNPVRAAPPPAPAATATPAPTAPAPSPTPPPASAAPSADDQRRSALRQLADDYRNLAQRAQRAGVPPAGLKEIQDEIAGLEYVARDAIPVEAELLDGARKRLAYLEKTWLTAPAPAAPQATPTPTPAPTPAPAAKKPRARKAKADVLADTARAVKEEDQAVAEDTTRVPRGGLAPDFKAYSFTNRASVFEQAFRDAGVDPDRGRLMAADSQIEILRRLLVRTFGFADVKNEGRGRYGKATAPDAIDQMLDAYRNVQFMAHALGLPLKSIGLGGRLTLSMEQFKSQYLGVYDPAERRIALPGRTNSFAHEWAHGLDHYLLERLNQNPNAMGMLSQNVRSGGINPTGSVEGAFVEVLNSLFFDQAGLAARALHLQQIAAQTVKQGPNQGQPTAAARAAQVQLNKLVQGNFQGKGVDSAYAQRAKAFGDPNYWANPAEMLARAFEAYVASKVEAAGGTNEFITKSDEAYLNMADVRLRETFPKAGDRANIFLAFENLFAALQREGVFGTDPVAARPGNYDIVDPMHWFKHAANPTPLTQAVVEEARALKNGTVKDFIQAAKERGGLVNEGPAPVRNLLQRMADNARIVAYSQRGVMKMLLARAKGGQLFLQDIVNGFATDPGTGRLVGETYESAVARRSRQWISAAESIVTNTGFKNGFRGAAKDRVRDLLLSKSPAGATAEEVQAAAGLRRLLNDVWRAMQDAGVEVGYVTDTGYLSRIVVDERVFSDPDRFETQAAKVYQDIFDADVGDPVDSAELLKKSRQLMRSYPTEQDIPAAHRAAHNAVVALLKQIDKLTNSLKTAQDPAQVQAQIDQLVDDLDIAMDELVDEIREPWSRLGAREWKERILLGSPTEIAVAGPLASFTNQRTLPPSADTHLKDFLINDPLESVVMYAHHAARKLEATRRLGSVVQGATDDINDVMKRPDVKAAMDAQPGRYNPNTEAGRLAIINNLADRATDNLLEMKLREAVRSGAAGPDVQHMKSAIHSIIGYQPGGTEHQVANSIATAVYAFGTIALLPRTIWTSITEPAVTYMRTGSVRTSIATLGAYMKEAVRSSQSSQERARLAAAIGLVTTPQFDAVVQQMMSTRYADSVKTNKLLASFFTRTGLTHLTNAQRRATLNGSFVWMQELGRMLRSPDKTVSDQAAADLRELGIPDDFHQDFTDWIMQKKTLPSLDDLRSQPGQYYMVAANRFADQVIQQPTKVDKPIYAATPIGRLMFGLTSFGYSFVRNVHFALANKAIRNAEIRVDNGQSVGAARAIAGGQAAAQLVAGFAVLWLAQFALTMLRESLFNSDQWEEKERKGELGSWLIQLAGSRTGILGPVDPLVQAYTGLKYQRDLTGLTAGPYPNYILNAAQSLIGTGGVNSPNTNTTEWNRAKAAYQLGVVPALGWGLSMVPGGPVVGTAAGAALQVLTSNQSANRFADALVGEKTSVVKARERELRAQGKTP